MNMTTIIHLRPTASQCDIHEGWRASRLMSGTYMISTIEYRSSKRKFNKAFKPVRVAHWTALRAAV